MDNNTFNQKNSPSQVYNSLPHINEVKKQETSKIQPIIDKLPESFGIGILHRHFYLQNNECVVTELSEYGFQTYVDQYNPEKHIPWQWMYENGQFHPYEFIILNSQYFYPDQKIIDQVFELIRKEQMSFDYYGMTIDLKIIFPKFQKEASLVEITDEEKRTQKHYIVENYSQKQDDIETRFFKKSYDWCGACSHTCLSHKICNGHRKK